MKLFTISLLLLLPLFSAGQTFLDSSFGINGIASPVVNGSNDGEVSAIETSNALEFFANAGAVIKCTVTGSFNTGFGNNGTAAYPSFIYNGFSYYYIPSVLIEQPDGKILAGGTIDSQGPTQTDFFLYRLLPNGLGPDISFGSNGIVQIDFDGGQDHFASMDLQPDGKIVLVGRVDSGFTQGFGVVRILATGSIDNTFGVNGKTFTNVGLNYNTTNSVKVLPNGKIMAAGHGDHLNSGIDFVVTRYLADGTADTSFNHSGKLYANGNGIGYGLLHDMKVQQDGKIILCGGSSTVSSGFLIVRLNTDGSKDTTFNHTGEQTLTINNTGTAEKLVVQPDGKIIVGGHYYTGSIQENWGLLRVDPNGEPDSSFGDMGRITLSIADRQHRISSMKQQADGKLLVGGYYELGTWPNLTVKRIIARFDTDYTNGIVRRNLQHPVVCFPNPADEIVYVRGAVMDKISRVEILDAMGRIVYAETPFLSAFIRVSDFPEGQYFLRFYCEDSRAETVKLLIKHH